MFDFSSYNSPPAGWRVQEASKDRLMLLHKKSRRSYIVEGPKPGEFILSYKSELSPNPQFVMKTDSLYRILRSIGALRDGQVQTLMLDNASKQFRL